LHAAVVELVALDNAKSIFHRAKLVSGDKEGRGGIYNFVTKRGACRGVNSKISWTQWKPVPLSLEISKLLADRRQFGRRILFGALTNITSKPTPAQNGAYRQEHQKHHRFQGHLGGRGQTPIAARLKF